MISNWQRFAFYLDAAEKGFFLIEACDFDIVEIILSDIRQKKEALFVNFASVDTEYYNVNFDRNKYDCVVFYNLQFMNEAVRVIDSFNMNRDNFAANNIIYIFILPKFLSDYLVVNTPNLHSYMTGHIELGRAYEPPFKPLMSVDNFTIDKRQIREERIARRDYKTVKNVTTYKELFDNIEYYKYNRASLQDLADLLDSVKNLYINDMSNECGSLANVDTSNVEKFYVEFVKVAFYQHRLEAAEYAGMVALTLLSNDLVSDVIDYDEYMENKSIIRQDLYSAVKCGFACSSLSYVRVLEIIEVSRFYASILFYQKEYNFALDWFTLIDKTLDSYQEKGYEFIDMLCMNKCDMVLCEYKLNDGRMNRELTIHFDKALQLRSDNDLDVKTLFVLDYNDLVYKIKSGNILYEDYNFSECRADYYKRVCSEKSSIFTSYLSLVAWIRGCIDGNVDEALELNKYALNLKRQVLTENHYSIAESHYCNAVLYLMSGDTERAKVCWDKALKIMSVNPEKNHTLLGIIHGFNAQYNSALSNLSALQ